METISNIVKQRRQAADDSLVNKREMWKEHENLFLGNLDDKISDSTKSKVFDHKISTYIIESEARVMAQVPVGKVKAISKNDMGASALMNLILDKYVVPNANAQLPFLVKLRMLHRMSKIYGNAFYMVDWDVKQNGYVGPDMWLISPWDIFPQVGATSLEDSEYIIVRSWKPLSFFEKLRKADGYKNLDTVITKLKQSTGDKQSRDSDSKTQREEDMETGVSGTKGDGFYEVLSMYERDRWVDVVPAAEYTVIRDGKNRGIEGELPVGNKWAIPMFEDFMGMGDVERGKSMQYVMNSAWNLALDSAKMSIFPPVIFNKDIIIPSSIKRVAGANWIARGNPQLAAQAIQLSPQGIQTFQSIYQSANAALLNQFGTTDTTISSNIDNSFGKTPQALKQQAARENSRDAWDKFYIEIAINQIMKKMVNLVSQKQSSAISVRLFGEEIKTLFKKYPELQSQYDPKTGDLKINKSQTGSVLYDYEMVSGSSFAVDKQAQQENILALINLLLQNAQMGQQGITSPFLELLKVEGTSIKFSKLLTSLVSENINNWDEIVDSQDSEKTPAEEDDAVMEQHKQQFMDLVAKIDEGDISQIPPTQGVSQDMPQQMPQGGMNVSNQAGLPQY
jgi:hypothetical protein